MHNLDSNLDPDQNHAIAPEQNIQNTNSMQYTFNALLIIDSLVFS